MRLKLFLGIAALLALSQLTSYAQTPAPPGDSLHVRCGLSHDYIASLGTSPSDPNIPAGFPASAIKQCGKYQIYFYDLAYRPGEGFADASVGLTRQNTLCAVLTYVQSVFDFSNVPSGQYIRLKVDTSYTHTYHSPFVDVLGWGAPFYKSPVTTGAVVNGFVWDYLTSSTGTDPNPGGFHADLRVNFDSVYSDFPRFYSFPLYGEGTVAVDFQNGLGSVQECQHDLYSILLHATTHTLGYWSWTDAMHTGSYSTTNYTSLDTSFRVSYGWYDVATDASTTLSRVYPSYPWAYDALWADNSPAPYRIYMGAPGGGSSHFPTYYLGTRVSSGAFQSVVLRDNIAAGVMSRTYSKDELRVGKDILGLNFNPVTFATSSPTAQYYYNKRPYCSKNYSERYNKGFFGDIGGLYNYYFDTVAADFAMVNNIGSSLAINLGADTSLHDDDGDTMRYVPGSIFNIRGCGQGGNNHKLLALSNGNRTITFTPRPNFYGRVQFAVTLTDGKETGTVVIYTIDCEKGTNVSVPAGGNLVLNGDFEEGSEVKIKDTAEMVPAVAGYAETNNSYGIKWEGRFSDCHPYSNNVAIRNSYVECKDAHTLKQTFGHLYTSFPWDIDSFGMGAGMYLRYPDAYLGQGNRYQLSRFPDLFNLGDSVRKCHNYLLEFDAVWTATYFVFPYPAEDSIYIAFTDGSHLNKTTPDDAYKNFSLKPVPIKGLVMGRSWRHFSIPLSYCSDTPSTVLFLKMNGFSAIDNGASIIMDNVSLKEQAYSLEIGDSLITPCIRRLYPKVSSVNSCSDTAAYTWKTLSGKVLATSSVIDVSPTITTKYILNYSTGCATLTDTIEVQGSALCPCSVGSVFGDTAVFFTLTGTVDAVPALPLYYVATNTTLAQNSLIKNANVLCAPNVRITIADSVLLTLDSAHLFTCPTDTNMWQGIELASGTLKSGRIIVKNNSMIEDARAAIFTVNPKTPASGDIISSVHAVYNRNQYNIFVANYNPTTPATYPFTIKSNVFTARGFTASTFAGYPKIWPAAQHLKAKITPSYSDSMKPSFIINKTYPRAKDKKGVMCYMGIEFDYVGYTNMPFTSSRTFSEVAIGGGSLDDSANMFDNLKYGIYCNRSNMVMRNNTFINLSKRFDPSTASAAVLPDWGGIGIFARSDSNRHDRVRIIQSETNQTNRFHDCFDAIGVDKMAEVSVFNAIITSSHKVGSVTPGAAYPTEIYTGSGMWLDGHMNHYLWTATNNTISGVHTGIAANLKNPKAGAATNFDNNKFYNANPDAAYNFPTFKAKQYIFLAINAYNSSAASANSFTANNNFMDKVFNGIQVNSLSKSSPIVDNNQITLWDTSITGITNYYQFGVKMDNATSGAITNNVIRTPVINTANDRIRGVYANFNTNLKVCSNTAKKMGRAFDFSGTTAQTGTRWTLNKIDTAWKGFVLGSDIGDQALMTYMGMVPMYRFGPSGNQWLGGPWGSGKSQTYTANTIDSKNSKIYLRSAVAAERPTINSFEPGSIAYSVSSLLNSTNPLVQNCAGFYDIPVTKGGGGTTGPGPKSLGAMILADSMGYGTEYRPNQWMAQLAIYRLGLLDSNEYDTAGIFGSFMAAADSSRFRWVTDIEDAFAAEDLSQVASLLASPAPAIGRVAVNSDVVVCDYTEADGILNNYADYFSIYLHYLQGTMNASDSALLYALAHKCPDRDGAVVYQARGLQDQVTREIGVYADEGCAADSNGQYRIGTEGAMVAATQAYVLYPNPNSGVFSIVNTVSDDEPVAIKVYNAIGMNIYQTNANFIHGRLDVNTGQKLPGTYLVCITDKYAQTTCLRFVIK